MRSRANKLFNMRGGGDEWYATPPGIGMISGFSLACISIFIFTNSDNDVAGGIVCSIGIVCFFISLYYFL